MLFGFFNGADILAGFHAEIGSDLRDFRIFGESGIDFFDCFPSPEAIAAAALFFSNFNDHGDLCYVGYDFFNLLLAHWIIDGCGKVASLLIKDLSKSPLAEQAIEIQ